MNFKLILTILLENEDVFRALKKRYNEIFADLASAKDNSNCSCRGRVSSFLEKKYKDETEKKFIDDLVQNSNLKDAINKVFREDEDINSILSVSHILEKQEGYYKKFLDFLQEKKVHHYIRSINIIDHGKHVEIFLFGFK